MNLTDEDLKAIARGRAWQERNDAIRRKKLIYFGGQGLLVLSVAGVISADLVAEVGDLLIILLLLLVLAIGGSWFFLYIRIWQRASKRILAELQQEHGG